MEYSKEFHPVFGLHSIHFTINCRFLVEIGNFQNCPIAIALSDVNSELRTAGETFSAFRTASRDLQKFHCPLSLSFYVDHYVTFGDVLLSIHP
ncbi:hypothetical protein CEXT_738521 [Caerostris extrusa]|uniref:Uncharacterized protein n=1 Tax=Caerostris extrusa TaxID=172846 RepID=A0AAV4W354_CAEEX|nr:hypothetical protein CEXT_738521 [Caerostris extrusa]